MSEPIVNRGLKIIGENPMIVLYRPDSDDIVALVSMWKATYSPVGPGRALLIWVDPDASGLGADARLASIPTTPILPTMSGKTSIATTTGSAVAASRPIRRSPRASRKSPAGIDSTASPAPPA